MLKNVNKLQNVEDCLHFIASNFPLTRVGLPYKLIKPSSIHNQDDNRIPIGGFEQRISKTNPSDNMFLIQLT